MGEISELNIRDSASVSVLRNRLRTTFEGAEFSDEDIGWILLVATELAKNQLDHADGGVMRWRRIARGDTAGIEVEAEDAGPGFEQPGSALAGLVTGKTLGVGLAAVRRHMSEIDVDTRLGRSTTLTARRFTAPVARQPEVAILGRALEHESGDNALVRRMGHVLWLAVADGTGHGLAAWEASHAALHVLDPLLSQEPKLDEALETLHTALQRTRGAALTLARWDLDAQSIRIAGVGNVAARLYDQTGAVQGAAPNSGMLGYRFPKVRVHALSVPKRATLVLATDGISTRKTTMGTGGGRNAARVAERLFREAVKPHDDALVLVVR